MLYFLKSTSSKILSRRKKVNCGFQNAWIYCLEKVWKMGDDLGVLQIQRDRVTSIRVT
ncbi:hypothetical protein KFK09_004627 [Dendrobium nobile]|uniref:Uncharacterized protein n=1 Tax=Dendrobium nobile TaxID=94219 RepID=A0A8T3C3D0_DENNO|nr:hypothetical protein KFK09_004627 [Dendrobium nobile]